MSHENGIAGSSDADIGGSPPSILTSSSNALHVDDTNKRDPLVIAKEQQLRDTATRALDLLFS